jgi:hypothetical protein
VCETGAAHGQGLWQNRKSELNSPSVLPPLLLIEVLPQKRTRYLGHDHPDDIGRANPETPRQNVRVVIQGFNSLLYALR